MNLEKFFAAVAKLRNGKQLSQEEQDAVASVMSSSDEVVSTVNDAATLREENEKLTSKVSKLEDDNFKYRERARTHDQQIEEKVAEATKELQEKLDKAEAAVAEAAAEVALAALKASLAEAGVHKDLIEKAVKLVEDTHYTETKTKAEDGTEIVERTFDAEKFREDNEIFFTTPKQPIKGLGGVGNRPTKPATTKETADSYISGTYSRPDRKGP